MHIVVSDPGSAFGGATSPCPPAATIRDPTDLLHIDMDQLARCVSFIPPGGGLRCADHLPGERVTLAQVRHLMPSQDPTDRPRRHTDLVRKPIRANTKRTTSCNHPLLDRCRRPRRRRMRPRGSVLQPGIAFNIEPRQPPMRTLARDPHCFGRMSHRPSQDPDPVNNQTTTMNVETSVTVTHEDLPVGAECNHHSTRRSSPMQLSPTSWPSRYEALHQDTVRDELAPSPVADLWQERVQSPDRWGTVSEMGRYCPEVGA